MKKSDLKKVMKPLIRECINEILIEEGVLSNVVSEVVMGLNSQVIVEKTNKPQYETTENIQLKARESRQKVLEHKKKMLDAIGKDAFNGVDLFEGTSPMSSYESGASSTPKAGSVDLGSPNDAGVDISSIMGGASQIWKAMK